MKRTALGLLPLVLLAGLVFLVRFRGPVVPVPGGATPVERLAVERVVLNPDDILLHVLNSGSAEVTIAQVAVNGSFWSFDVQPAPRLPRLGRAVVRVPYPWNPGEAQRLSIITSLGATFEAEVEAAAPSPGPTPGAFATLGLLGTFVGIVPVLLGLLWLPFLRRLNPAWYGFFLSLTVGLLVFLGVEALAEGIETIGRVPGVLQGPGVLAIGFLLAFLVLSAIGGRRMSTTTGAQGSPPLATALFIAIGIGVHNLGEGLAIGGAIATGEVAFGTLLVLGFMIHNVTEGMAIVAPVSRSRAGLAHLAGLGFLAGAPAILGAWIGGFAWSAALSLFFLGIAAGAIIQVAYEIARQMARSREQPLLATRNVAGFLAGLAAMYGTGLLVTA